MPQASHYLNFYRTNSSIKRTRIGRLKPPSFGIERGIAMLVFHRPSLPAAAGTRASSARFSCPLQKSVHSGAILSSIQNLRRRLWGDFGVALGTIGRRFFSVTFPGGVHNHRKSFDLSSRPLKRPAKTFFFHSVLPTLPRSRPTLPNRRTNPPRRCKNPSSASISPFLRLDTHAFLTERTQRAPTHHPLASRL